MRITNIKTYQIEGKLKEPFWWGNGGNDKRSASIVKIETDEGIDGWGEGWGGINEFKDILKSSVIGQDPFESCLLYTSPSPRDRTRSRMPSSA